MILGFVDANDAIVPIWLYGANWRAIDAEAVLDTGFNEWLTLPSDIISVLELHFRGDALYTLADGSEVSSRTFAVELNWLGLRRRVLAVEVEGAALLGMAMLHGTRLTIDVTEGGVVQIEPLTK